MIKRWIYRVLALGLVTFALVKTKNFYNTDVAEYEEARAEQRRIWDEKAERNKQASQENVSNDTSELKQEEETVETPSFVFEPSEATGDDFFLDLSTYDMWESGEYLPDSGEKEEHKRRLRYPELLAVECPEYIVTVTEGYSLFICEYDSEKNLIRSMAYKGGDTYAASKNGAYFSVTLRKNEQEKSLSPGQWGGIFSNGIEVIICTEKWLQ